MLRVIWLTFAVAACGDREASSQVVAPTRPGHVAVPDAGVAAPPPAAVRSAPHGAAISQVALTDAGDAALTLDELDHLRLWPTLDGKHEPVIVRGPTPRQLALGRDGGELVAAVLDQVGGLELIRFDAAGSLLGRTRVAGEPGFAQVVVAAGGMLARRSDHTVLWIDGHGRVRGTLVPEPGEQVIVLAARRDAAIAAVSDGDRSEVKQVRRIELGSHVRWGARIDLPEALASTIALAPSGRRLAGITAKIATSVAIIDLAPVPKVIATTGVTDSEPDRVLGFTEEDRLVMPAGAGYLIGASTPSDPWADPGTRWRARFARGGAIADGVVVSPLGTSLALSTRDHTTFLGYRDLAVGVLHRAADRTALVTGDRVLWLDDRLRITRTGTLPSSSTSSQVVLVDDRHAVRAVWEQPKSSNDSLTLAIHRLFLVDTETGTERDLGTFPIGAMLAYDRKAGVLINAADPASLRLQLDLAAGTVTPLRPLKTRMYANIEPLDPELAGGVMAVAHMPGIEGGYYIETYVDDGKPTRKPLAPSSKVKLGEVSVLGVDRTGATWVATATAPRKISAYRQGKLVATFKAPGAAAAGTVALAGDLIVMFDPTQVYALDATGTERWRTPVWRVNLASVSSDTRAIYLYTPGGLVTLDAATGRRLATGCGWSFGLSATEPNQTVFGDALVCTEEGE